MFLEVVCLREHVAALAPDAQRAVVVAVAAAMPEPVIDYTRAAADDRALLGLAAYGSRR